MSPANPTAKTYAALNQAFDFFNDRLFGGELPACLVTLQRKNKAYGYFAGGRFGSKDGAEITDEQSLSTLAHEMAHLWQHHFGKPSRAGYHNKEWAAKMHEIGLHPSDTGQPGGKETGQSCSHYIVESGRYARVFAELAAQPDFTALYVELWDDADARKARKAKSASKTRYTCPSCELNAWAKPGVRLICGECDETMAAAEEAE